MKKSICSILALLLFSTTALQTAKASTEETPTSTETITTEEGTYTYSAKEYENSTEIIVTMKDSSKTSTTKINKTTGDIWVNGVQVNKEQSDLLTQVLIEQEKDKQLTSSTSDAMVYNDAVLPPIKNEPDFQVEIGGSSWQYLTSYDFSFNIIDGGSAYFLYLVSAGYLKEMTQIESNTLGNKAIRRTL